MSKQKTLIGALVAAAIVAAIVIATGGSDDAASSTGTDAGFVAEMTPHHESAIEMAEIAQRRGQHPEIKQLAGDIISTQSSEIEALGAIGDRLGATDGASLDLSEDAMGMSMDTSELETAKPFDRAFIDMMVPHHQGAIVMARAELDSGSDTETRSLAEGIISAQSREIEEMNAWRSEWYGAPSPAGGIPEPGDTVGSMAGMSH